MKVFLFAILFVICAIQGTTGKSMARANNNNNGNQDNPGHQCHGTGNGKKPGKGPGCDTGSLPDDGLNAPLNNESPSAVGGTTTPITKAPDGSDPANLTPPMVTPPTDPPTTPATVPPVPTDGSQDQPGSKPGAGTGWVPPPFQNSNGFVHNTSYNRFGNEFRFDRSDHGIIRKYCCRCNRGIHSEDPYSSHD